MIWQGQRFPPEALQTADGRAVAVVNPGRRGGGSGPDFLDAVVLLDGVERRGDVELHVRASSFRGHGHDRDPAYCKLALHVVYQADERETRLADGALVPVAAFAPWLEGRAGELRSWLQAPEIWQAPCREANQRLGEEMVRTALEAAGARRFEARVERMQSEIVRLGEEEALWWALLDTLGVGGDREGFRRLAAAFPASLAATVADLEASLVYVSGLGPAPRDEGWLPPDFEAGGHPQTPAKGPVVPGTAVNARSELPVPVRPAVQSHGRPANRPGMRLAGLAALARRAIGQAGNRARGQQADGPLTQMALASLVDAAKPKQLVAAWTAPPQIGVARAQELLVNAVLPFVAAHGMREEALDALRRLAAAPAYGKTAFLESNLAPAKGRVARNALGSQGLLGYVAKWCSQGGCGRCPLSRVEDAGQGTLRRGR